MKASRKRSPLPSPEFTYCCIMDSWAVLFASGAYGRSGTEPKPPFWEETELRIAGHLTAPFRGVARIEVAVLGTRSGIRHWPAIGSIGIHMDVLSAVVEVPELHFATTLTAFAAGQVKRLELTGESAKKRGRAAVSIIVLSTEPEPSLQP
jgi:hypothetical protein